MTGQSVPSHLSDGAGGQANRVRKSHRNGSVCIVVRVRRPVPRLTLRGQSGSFQYSSNRNPVPLLPSSGTTAVLV